MYWEGQGDVSTKDKYVNNDEEAMPIVQTQILVLQPRTVVNSFSIRVQSQGLHFHPTFGVNNRCMTLFTLTVRAKMKR